MTIGRGVCIVFLAALFLAGCASGPKKFDTPQPPNQQRGATEQGQSGSEGTSTGLGLSEDELQTDALDDPDSPLSTRIIYFDFDSAQVRDDFTDVLAAHGRYLAEHPDQNVRLEGHADERGSREYNLALGERRAQSVQQLLELQGTPQGQMELISYGEELPAVEGHDEEAWAQNRRVEIVYEGDERASN